jgi:cytidylate kinase
VVFPEAELKLFVTASPEIRAKRRFDELTAKGGSVTYDEILKNVQERDFIDSTREISPLKKADDALLLDNSNMTREEQLEWAISKVEERIKP